MACSLASRSSRFAAALRADLDAISARHPKDPAVGTKSWLQSNKKLNVYLDTPNPHESNPESFRGDSPDLIPARANDSGNRLMSSAATVFSQSFFHGTRADLKPGDLIVVGYQSNFTEVKPLSWVYFAATLDAAIWGAELAAGTARGRIYVVEPTGPIMDDPNVTDKKFPGDPTLSYRSREPLRVIAEVTQWQGHAPERLQQMRDNVARLKAEGGNIID